MKKNRKSKWIVFLAGLASLFILGGCSVGASLENTISSRDLTAHVTYYSNGGEFEGTPDKKEMYFKEGSKALDIGTINPLNGTATVSRNNYQLVGWYYAVLDEDGNPTFEDEAKKVYKLGDKVDFTVPLQSGDHWQIVAKWSMNVMLNVKLVLEDETAEIPVAVKEGETPVSYGDGEIVQKRQYSNSGKVENPGDGEEPFEKAVTADYTFVDYYMDEECKVPVSWPIVKTDDQAEDGVVYAKYIKGTWNVLRNYVDVNEMLDAFGEGNKYYLAKNIDVLDRCTYYPKENATFKDEIQGNGFAIKNLSVVKGQDDPLESNESVSLFGAIASTAKIENLQLTDLSISYTVKRTPAYVYFVFTSIEEGATVSNVRLSGSMRVAKPVGESIAKRLYGDYATDEAYLQASGGNGFTVDGTAEEIIK